MSPDNRNQFLDGGDSDDDAGGRGYDSEDDFQKGGRSTKRRRVDEGDDSDSDGQDFSSDAEGESDQEGGADLAEEDDDEEPNQQKTQQQPSTKDKKQKKPKEEGPVTLPSLVKPLTKRNLVATEAAIKKSGVVYISRVPPFMKPAKVRSLLEPHGTINRMFLAPEDPTAHSRRVRAGGNKKRCYTEGWVEFVRKGDAKRVCELLNAQTIGGKKGGYYRDDLWNLVYLKGFKWHNLTEQIAAENAERASRMRAEIGKSTRENKEFVRNLERAKVLDGMHAKQEAKRKRKKDDSDGGGGGGGGGDDGPSQNERKRTFKQVPLAKKRKQDDAAPEPVQRLGSKIFG